MDVARIETLFRENFTHFGDLGASLCVWCDGREVISLAAGWRDRDRTQPWTAETPVLVWSATKGPAVACVLHSMQERGLTLDTRVADVWPEFAAHGKGVLTIGGALSHQSGVPALDRAASVFDHDEVARAIAEQAPFWEPGTAHGYGPRLYGFLLDELVRRIAGTPLGEYWRAVFADPLALDFWMGVPADLVEKVAPIFPPKAEGEGPKIASNFFPSGGSRSPTGESGSRMKPAENAVSVSSTRSSPCTSVRCIHASVSALKNGWPSSEPPAASMA